MVIFYSLGISFSDSDINMQTSLFHCLVECVSIDKKEKKNPISCVQGDIHKQKTETGVLLTVLSRRVFTIAM